MKICVDAAAKINLSLDITGQLENGYHSLYMVMQSVGLFDTVILEKTDSGNIEITCSEPSLPCDKRNIAHKAALTFFADAGIKNEGLKIHIEKRIPFAAGLAGGSADAAAVICGLNALYQTGFCETALCAMGIKVGSDVPFCITGGTRLVENVGEKISPLPAMPHCYFVLAKPEQGVSTAEAYTAFNGIENVKHPDNIGITEAVREGDLPKIAEKSANVFEQVIDLPEFSRIRTLFSQQGALLTRMSGSGPTMFGIFEDKTAAEQALSVLKEADICPEVCLCEPVNYGVKVPSFAE